MGMMLLLMWVLMKIMPALSPKKEKPKQIKESTS
jgi:flagellar biogenesis protein FliO